MFWVGTVAGMHRFDPLTQRFSRLADDQRYKGTYLEELTNTILEDNSGLLWFESVKGIAILDPVSGALKQFSPSELPAGNPIPYYRVLHEDDHGDVWVANGEGLFHYDRGSEKFIRIPIGAKDERMALVRSIKDHEGVYWFATLYHGVWRFDPKTNKWKSYRHDPHNAFSLTDDRLRTVCEDNDGRIWAGTISGGLCYLDRSTGRFHSYKPSGKNARYEGVSFIIRDSSGLLWVGYDGAGLVKVNPYQNKFHHILLPPSDAKASGDNFFKSLIVDHRGDVWLGMYDQGLSVLNRKTGQVKRYRHNPSDARSLCSNSVFSLLEEWSENVWIGTSEGLDEFDRRSGRLKHHNLPAFATIDRRGKIVTALSENSLGTIWCGTVTHLFKFTRSTEHFDQVLSTVETFGFPIPPAINVITPSSGGAAWVGTHGGGMLKLKADGTIERRFTRAPGLQNSLSHNSVKTILIAPDGQRSDSSEILWIGTEEGLNRYDPVHDHWRVYRTSDGMANDFIYGILMDEHRRLWISTNRGLSRMDTRDPEHPQFRNYTTDDGLQSYEFNTNVYFKAPNGEMFFGGVNGFNTFFPDSVTDNPHVPPVVITGFKKFDQPFDLGGDIGTKEFIELKYSESVFSFEFAALEFTNSARNQYAYKMDGFDKDWIYCGTRREARYTNLDPGEYTFRVKGSNNDGVWSEQGTSIRVVIIPPFWRTGWFVVAMSVLGIGAIGGTVRYVSTRKLRSKIEQLERERAIQEERYRTRDRIARDLHDDLASTVGSANFFIESVKTQLKDAPKQAKEFLDKTSSLLTEAEEAMSDIVWSVSPQHDTLESLLARIRLTTVDICKANRIKYEVDIAGDITKHTLIDDVRRGVYLIFKESINNAVRHASASMIRVTFRVEGDFLILAIQDNGKGIPSGEDAEVPTKRGHGLRNMKKRAEEIQAAFTIETIPGQGTKVQLSKRMTQLSH